MLEEARAYLRSQHWCHAVTRERFGLGVGGVVGVFMFELTGDPGVDRALWVVCGDVPTAYLVTDDAPTPVAALVVYCEMMEAWIGAARGERPVAGVFPVAAEANEENARRLEKRVRLLRREVIPHFLETMP